MPKPLRKRPELPQLSNQKSLAIPPTPRALLIPSEQPETALRLTGTDSAPPLPRPRPRKESDGVAVLRGIKDLQQLQKQTIAVLESVKGTLDEIHQVLRSPEATRGMEKQQNAAMLLAKGFAREAIEQANGAVSLLPANPEPHLLLSLALAADGDVDSSLGMARKGLALFDRRQHPLAIEAGLLHALATLGCGAEALDRWSIIIETLPLPVLLENLNRIGACFPVTSAEEPSAAAESADATGIALLDELLSRRLERDAAQARAAARKSPHRRRAISAEGTVELHADDIPSPMLFNGLDAARQHHLPATHRAILSQIARRLQLAKDPGDIVKFLAECVLPLANRGLDRSSAALARSAVKRLLRSHADAMTLHRAMTKLELAGTNVALQEIASLLNHWRKAGRKLAAAQFGLRACLALLASGALFLIYVLWFINGGGALAGKSTALNFLGIPLDAIWFGPLLLALGGIVGTYALFGRTWHLALPHNRPALTLEELTFLNTTELRQSLRTALHK